MNKPQNANMAPAKFSGTPGPAQDSPPPAPTANPTASAQEPMDLTQEQLSELTDDQLFNMCRKFGFNALFWRSKFIGLLPEVNRRRLYERKNCASIFEFAKKMAGISEEQVCLVLNTKKRFEDKPVLLALLVKGEVSINKLSRIASVATVENQEFWATQVRLLPQRALDTLVRDEKYGRKNQAYAAGEIEGQNGFLEPLKDPKSLCAQINLQPSLKLSTAAEPTAQDLALIQTFSPELTTKLHELSAKGFDINALLLELLENRELEIALEKEEISSAVHQKHGEQNPVACTDFENCSKTSRYIPKKIRDFLKKEYGNKCAIPHCKHPSQNIHHTNRFALARIHDPYYMAPLCKEHHLIAHTIDVNFHDKRLKALAVPKMFR